VLAKAYWKFGGCGDNFQFGKVAAEVSIFSGRIFIKGKKSIMQQRYSRNRAVPYSSCESFRVGVKGQARGSTEESKAHSNRNRIQTVMGTKEIYKVSGQSAPLHRGGGLEREGLPNAANANLKKGRELAGGISKNPSGPGSRKPRGSPKIRTQRSFGL